MAEAPPDGTVPGMAEAIEERMAELHMGPSRLAREAGLTNPGLAPIRKGLRKRYADSTKLGVARALRWPDDAIDRLLDGEDPSTWSSEPRATDAVPTAIHADPHLDERAKSLLVAFYRAAIEQSPA